MHFEFDPTRVRKKKTVKSGARFALLLISALIFAGYSAATVNYSSSKSTAQGPRLFRTSPGLPSSAADVDKGDFKLVYGKVKNKKNLGHLEKMIKDSKMFESIIADLNKEFILPFDVPIQFMECTLLPDTKETGVENAWYDSEAHDITICYELVARTETLFRDDEPTPEELNESVMGSTVHTFFHELGHAMVDIYKLPITGKEEDAVDQLSTFILVSGGDEGEMAALNGAVAFLKEDSDGDLDDMQLADSHSLNKQRFFNIICWIYGGNEEKFADLVTGDDAVLPENRVGACKGEFDQIQRSWTTLLTPHMKHKADTKAGRN